MKRFIWITALLGLLLAACGGRNQVVYARYAPSGSPYESIEIQVTGRDQFDETGELSITTEFTSRSGEVLTIAMKRQGEALFFAQDIPSAGIQANEGVSDASLRSALIDAGITNAGQFKLDSAKNTIDLIMAFSDPALKDAIVPAQFQLLESNLSVTK